MREPAPIVAADPTGSRAVRWRRRVRVLAAVLALFLGGATAVLAWHLEAFAPRRRHPPRRRPGEPLATAPDQVSFARSGRFVVSRLGDDVLEWELANPLDRWLGGRVPRARRAPDARGELETALTRSSASGLAATRDDDAPPPAGAEGRGRFAVSPDARGAKPLWERRGTPDLVFAPGGELLLAVHARRPASDLRGKDPEPFFEDAAGRVDWRRGCPIVLEVVSARTGERRAVFRDDGLPQGTFVADTGRVVVAFLTDVRVYTPGDRQPVATWPRPRFQDLVAVSDDGRRLLFRSEDDGRGFRLRVLDAATGRELGSWVVPTEAGALAPDGSAVVFGREDGGIEVAPVD